MGAISLVLGAIFKCFTCKVLNFRNIYLISRHFAIFSVTGTFIGPACIFFRRNKLLLDTLLFAFHWKRDFNFFCPVSISISQTSSIKKCNEQLVLKKVYGSVYLLIKCQPLLGAGYIKYSDRA